MRCIKLNQILDGKALADKICVELKQRLDSIRSEPEIVEDGIRLRIVTSGDDEASKIYVRNKIRRCEELGIDADVRHFDNLDLFDVFRLYDETRLTPTIFQMPMTGDLTLNHLRVTCEDDLVDVDGFVTVQNVGDLAAGSQPEFYPCTPKGIMRLLAEYNIPLEGKSVCILGRSNIVGRPLLCMMEQAGATVTLCHSKTPEETLYRAIQMADIVVSATGVRNVISRDAMLQYGEFDVADKVFVDVGMNRDENGKLCGDIDPLVLEAAAAYTPVPGGVGPMTVAMLMENVVEYYERVVGE